MKPKAGYWFFRHTTIMLILLGMFLFLFPQLLPAQVVEAAAETPKSDEVPTMVKRHIFSPEDDQPEDNALGPRSEAAAKLDKELLFTGVIHSPQGKWAIIRPRNKSKRENAPWRLSEGDEIKGYHIKEIGSNYVILVSKDKPVRLDLYRGTKNRPAPPPTPQISSIPTSTKVTNKRPGGSILNTGKKVSRTRSNTVTKQRIIHPPTTIPSQGNGNNPAVQPPARPAATPFAELLKRAQQNKQNGGSAPVNPFSRMIQQQQQNQ